MLNFPTGAIDNAEISIQRAFANLSFDSPLVVATAPGDRTHLYVASQNGVTQVFEARETVGPAEVAVFLDLSDRTRANGEQGLLGLAFDPAYTSNGFVYVYYSANANPDSSTGDSVIARFTADRATLRVDRASERVLLRFAQPFNNHNGGGLAFGPDGMLYIASGDGGSGNDPMNNAQNLENLLGKILRIAPDGAVPADNPFVGAAGARGEIWAFGLRNPFRFSFDPATGRLWAGDVGQGALEEINLVTRGGNYGWRIFEGTRSNLNPDNRPITDFEAPIFVYDRNQGRSITGGRVYRGGRIPGLSGRYVYGDFVSGRVWALTEAAGEAGDNLEIGQVPNPSSFGEDLEGEILITAYDGGLYRLVPGDGSAEEFPQKLSDTGLFANLANLQASPGLVEYQPGAAFWSDGATKRRWFAVPGQQRIGFSPTEAWDFPVGTVTVKHFEIELADGTLKRLETRVFVHEAAGWQGYTYRWNAAGSDADLLPGSASVDLRVADGAGGTRTQTYRFPDRVQCLQCHTAAAGFVLGVRTNQLNGSFTYPGGVAENQLRALDQAGYLDQTLADPATYAALTDPSDPLAPLASRARAYLETNCSQCHRPGGPTPVDIDLRAATPIAGTGTIGVEPSGESFGVTGARRIAPGVKERSLIWTRMNTLDPAARMPPLASHVIDAEGVELIGDWIDAGAP
ncbi:MAG: PQQ-dependent sugar dehydrogenase [Panacagrimonas sp.]